MRARISLLAAAAAAAVCCLLTLIPTAVAQPQSGSLYWCSAFERGINFDWNNIGLNKPRTTWSANNNQILPSFVPACHQNGQETDSQAYTFSNGTRYRTNQPGSD
jgi:hypothetical protein